MRTDLLQQLIFLGISPLQQGILPDNTARLLQRWVQHLHATSQYLVRKSAMETREGWRDRNEFRGPVFYRWTEKGNCPMKTLARAAVPIAIAAFAITGSATAADLTYIRRSPPPVVYEAPVAVGPAYPWGPCPEDI